MEELEWLERGSKHHTAKRTISKLILSLANYEQETIAEFQNIVYRAKKLAASHGWPVKEHPSGRFSGVDQISITLPSRLPDIPPKPEDKLFFFRPSIYGMGFDGPKLLSRLKHLVGRCFGRRPDN